VPTKKTAWLCDYCNTGFDTEEEAKKHEEEMHREVLLVEPYFELGEKLPSHITARIAMVDPDGQEVTLEEAIYERSSVHRKPPEAKS
jgi:hypothetical protein